ncbi:TIGR03960 family B12-binding radical SAM protein [Desulfuribacillus alkaliarsenatis]|uniref:B12-binding domain-containing radical SAM protein n=1 Tax=Desulfuribacillus alkaliarsenatis TaxID=766136 RepID=A0A1E5G6H3_9FIRM|nr:TIGR03960 family B12-binding radical SAM protein [Desulfuribacillus alkaliarsenatis]OEF98354.1 B12-binding domain-containing radical SAM protein [Desulfuribacillus alkaliarsenatis]
MEKICQHDILTQVEKPARYAGNEWNIVMKDHAQMDVTFALAFPDVYEVGMSFLGYKILYHIINKRDTYYAERAFAPWVDMEQKIRNHNQVLTSTETKTPIKDFDFVSFTLQYEMSYTNILNMLDLSDLPLYAKDRTEEHPLVLAGGPCAFNPEPIADFFDLFVVGEGEEAVIDIADVYKEIKAEQKSTGKQISREETLLRLAKIPGVYVPRFYDVEYKDDGRVASITPNHPSIPAKVEKRVLRDLDATEYPEDLVVPFLNVVHDRVMLEIQRGCTRGCRFCQAGMVYRPVRERKKENLRKIARTLVDKTGYDEISLTSLASNDYSQIQELIHELLDEFKEEKIGISLPSLRADKFSVKLAEELQQMRKSGLTFAPEAGSQRLRDVINKGVNEEHLIDAVTSAFQSGYKQVKLYFMLGLPTETDEDIVGIAELAEKVVEAYRSVNKGKTRGLKVTVSTSLFVPKPHTPFQWVGQLSKNELQRRRSVLQNAIKSKAITYNWHDPNVSFLEGAVSRGDRRLSKAIYQAWKNGCKFDSWTEQFRNREWLMAYQEVGIDPEWYAFRNFAYDEILPWEHISSGVSKKYLEIEYERALVGKTIEDCRTANCTGCGVCQSLGVDVVVWKGEEVQ